MTKLELPGRSRNRLEPVGTGFRISSKKIPYKRDYTKPSANRFQPIPKAVLEETIQTNADTKKRGISDNIQLSETRNRSEYE